MFYLCPSCQEAQLHITVKLFYYGNKDFAFYSFFVYVFYVFLF